MHGLFSSYYYVYIFTVWVLETFSNFSIRICAELVGQSNVVLPYGRVVGFVVWLVMRPTKLNIKTSVDSLTGFIVWPHGRAPLDAELVELSP